MWRALLTIARQERAQVTACILLAGWMSLLSGNLLSWVTLKLAAIALTGWAAGRAAQDAARARRDCKRLEAACKIIDDAHAKIQAATGEDDPWLRGIYLRQGRVLMLEAAELAPELILKETE